MSAGATLLKLQQIDLELARNKSELANMPELKELASKRTVSYTHLDVYKRQAMARATCSTISWPCFRRKRTRSPMSSPTR